MNKKIISFIIVSFVLSLTGCASKSNFAQPYNPPSSALVSSPQSESSFVSDDSIWKADTLTTWGKLQHVRLKTLESAQSDDPYVTGWIKLATISKVYSTNTPQLTAQLMAWRQSYPSHPGNQLFPDNSVLQSLTNSESPKKVAVLLPLQGQYGTSGQAVKQGLMNAYYSALSKNESAPHISFYDTSKTSAELLYQKAVSEGADMVIGPLLKENVQALIHQSNVPTTTLTLNYTDSWGSLPANLYQFGLSPLDEARQVANLAFKKGGTHAILIAPQTDWGAHVSDALTSEWSSLGGSITATLYFDNKTNLSEAIPNLLGINPEEDQRRMKQDNNKQSLEEQRRQDFDVVFLLAPPANARQIVPLLRYYYVNNIPIYSTSIIYTGSPSPREDNDLNGVIFCDIPWTLKITTPAPHANRLYAIGLDAYLISHELNRMIQLPNMPVYGATGALTMTPQHQIFRRLAWAKFHAGQP